MPNSDYLEKSCNNRILIGLSGTLTDREKIVWAKHDWSKGTEERVLGNCED